MIPGTFVPDNCTDILVPRTLSMQALPMCNIKVCVQGRDSWQALIGFMPRHGATLLCLHTNQQIVHDYFCMCVCINVDINGLPDLVLNKYFLLRN